MLRLDWILAFAQITFPILLLIPTLISSFHISLPLADVGRYFVLVWVYYVVIVLGSTLDVQKDWLTISFLTFSVVIIGIALFYVTRWTLQEQVEIDRLRN